ncbi:RHS repeat-associated core domain-containing protein, partial [Luteimonas huabeiensis]|uniref:RHS repeat-associated core domain-containing protein n=1 Tax=Luteimonas huabeiensis TaxID=1244513 RepID=UPI002AA2A807
TVVPILAGLNIDERYARGSGANRHYFLTDALGSTRALTDSNGGVVQSYDYDPYGGTHPANATIQNPYRYTGREQDASGLYYYRARYYHPGMGRFVSEDSIGLAGGDANLYAYVIGDPVSLSDPSGNCPWCVGAGVGFGIELVSQLIQNGGNWGCLDVGALLTATALGAVGGGLGANALTRAARGMTNSTKGRVGEALSIANNKLKGSRLIETQTRSIPGYRTVVDSTWRSWRGATYYVESKFGSSGLTAAQRAAQRGVGDAYRVERWGYDLVGRAGAVGGGAIGGAAGGAIAGGGCGCN